MLQTNAAWRIKKMLTKIALVTALTLGAASVVMAAPEDSDLKGGYRELGPGGVVTDGVNPAYHRSLRGKSSQGYAGEAYGFAPVAPACVATKKHPCP
jgi:hypothetical protein